MQPNSHEITVFIIIATILILSLVIFMILILLLYQKKQVAFFEKCGDFEIRPREKSFEDEA